MSGRVLCKPEQSGLPEQEPVGEGRWQCVAMLPRNKKKRCRGGPCFAPLAEIRKAPLSHTGISYLALVP